MNDLSTWAAIVVLVAQSTIGDVLISRAMKGIGDVGELYARHGLWRVVGTVLTNGTFLSGIAFMAMAFFTLLFLLSWADVSLVAPASASLTFLSNAVSAKFFLREQVDRRRVIAVVLVAGGVAMLAA